MHAERYRAIIDQLDDAIIVTDDLGAIEMMNPSAERLLGRSAVDVIRESVPLLVIPTKPLKAEGVGQTIPADDGPSTRVLQWTGQVSGGPGRALTLEVRRLSPGGGFLFGIRERQSAGPDTEEGRNPRDGRAHIQGIGQVAASIGHELNNILQVFLGNATLLATEFCLTPGAAPLLEAMLAACRRATALSDNLFAISNALPADPTDTDVDALLAEIERMTFGVMPDSVTLTCRSTGGPLRVHVDAGQLEASILGLVLNALDAMPIGGVIEIEAGQKFVDRLTGERLGIPAGLYVSITVRDDGAGMTPEVRKQAFDPFFTTGSVGKGVGLGLARLAAFVSQSRGHVEMRSEEGKGTLVELLLPGLPAANT